MGQRGGVSVWIWVILPLSLSSGIYAVLAGGYYWVQGRPGMTLTFLGYVIANVGLMWDALTVK